VKTEGRKTERGGQEPGTNNNVVPFPRDWLGPREELIPFGPSAGHSAEDATATPGAEAFWAGDSDPLHAVLPASMPVAASVAEPRFRTGAGRVAIGGLVAAVLAAAVLGRIAGVPAGGSGPAIGSDVAAAGLFDLAQLRGAVGTPVIESSSGAAHHPVRHHARPVARVHHRPTVAARSSGSNSTTPASSATSAAAALATRTGQPASTSSGGASEPAATSSTPTHSSVSGHTASVHPGPVGPGAPFGPGHLK
jgi:hypothetical protein